MARGRPRRYQGLRITSFYLPIEHSELIDKLRELAERDGSTLSEKIVDAIREYIQVHYPGNPQVCLDSIIKPDAPKPLRLQALFDMQELEAVIRDLTNSKNHIHRQILVDRGKKLVLKLSKANMRLNDGKIDELIEEFISLL
jgi:hypothetical protein